MISVLNKLYTVLRSGGNHKQGPHCLFQPYINVVRFSLLRPVLIKTRLLFACLVMIGPPI